VWQQSTNRLSTEQALLLMLVSDGGRVEVE
jgi:hypothetical protein